MAKAIQNIQVSITLTLSEHEACDLYLHLNPKYVPNSCDEIKRAIADALRYTPKEAPDL